MTLAASAITPLLIILGALVGLGMGALLVLFVRQPDPDRQRERDIAIARDTARRTFDETVTKLFEREANGE